MLVFKKIYAWKLSDWGFLIMGIPPSENVAQIIGITHSHKDFNNLAWLKRVIESEK